MLLIEQGISTAICAAMLIISLTLLAQKGLHCYPFDQFHRQTLILFLCTIFSISLPVSVFQNYFFLRSLAIFLYYATIQWSIVGINHNSFDRWFDKERNYWYYIPATVVYIFPLLTMIPVYFYLVNEITLGTPDQIQLVYGETVVLIAAQMVTHLLAIITDIPLLLTSLTMARQIQPYQEHLCLSNKLFLTNHKKLVWFSRFIWMLTLVDVCVKILTLLGIVHGIDAATWMLVVALRAILTVKFGVRYSKLFVKFIAFEFSQPWITTLETIVIVKNPSRNSIPSVERSDSFRTSHSMNTLVNPSTVSKPLRESIKL